MSVGGCECEVGVCVRICHVVTIDCARVTHFPSAFHES